MNQLHPRTTPQLLMAAALGAMSLVITTTTMAAPGAHGPNGQHLDGPATMRAASASPRVEARSESFELVAELRPGELAIMVDRYETNEPVLGARLEVDSGALRAVANFRAEQGDYIVTDAAMLKALAAPGEHGLVFTLVAGQDSDLLDGTLVGKPGGAFAATAKNDHGHDHELERAGWIVAAGAAMGLTGGIGWWRRRRRNAGKLQGGL
ncbi:MAG: hypothetical protein RI988_4126 [Pseudomonadota bacterium]|jgi:hypothetical protein